MQEFRLSAIRQSKLAEGLAVQIRSYHALLTREMMMRYGRNNLGFLWVILEPMLLCVGVMIIWSFLKARFEHNIPVVALVLTGYMPLTLWRHLTVGGIQIFRRSVGLLYHTRVSLLDVFVTRIVLEIAGTTTAFVLVAGTLIATGLIGLPVDIGLVVAGWLTMAFLSIGFGFLIAIVTEYSEVAEKFIAPIQYIMVPLSGFFFMVDWLPTGAQNAAWYMPTVHCYEMVRGGYFGAAVNPIYNVWYPLAWGLALTAISISFLRNVRDFLHA